jgi:Transposase IS4
VNEVIAMLEDEQFVDASIYLNPPGHGIESDEDSDSEEGASANHLSSNQLTASAEFTINYGNENVNSLDIDSEDDDSQTEDQAGLTDEEIDTTEDQSPPTETNVNSLCGQPPPAVAHKWMKTDLKNQTVPNKPSQRQFTETLTPFAIFNAFFDDEVVEYMVSMTNLYAQRDKGKHGFTTDVAEMRLFLAMLLLSGYTVLPRRKMYWENSDDVFNKAMSDAMSRNRFEELLSVFHLADNQNLNASDTMAKVRPLFTKINEKCLQYFLNDECLSVDESMLPYYGRHSSKQRIMGKPIRMGYKMWVLASSDGYVLQFEPYQGAKKHGGTRSSSTSWGLGELVVLDLLEELPRESSYHIFIDNFFTSFRLLDHLRCNGIRATGVIRSNKLRQCPIESTKSLEKKARGFFDQRTDNRNSLTIVGWNDNRSVYVTSNAVGSEPKATVSRWCRKTSTRINVEQPNLIKMYNRYMGGVDRCDQNISTYRISTRSKKWWWALFVWVPDMVLQNCWLLYR